MELRVGLGHDIHRLAEGRKLMLGGVEINFPRGPLGHSDGDVLLHALTDAVLGAAGLGDIGEHFPNTDVRWKDADSSLFLREAVALASQAGWRIVNVDCTIWAERPKLSPYKQTIAQSVARIAGLEPGQVNVKAKSGEQVGPIGREEAIAADAAVLLRKAD